LREKPYIRRRDNAVGTRGDIILDGLPLRIPQTRMAEVRAESPTGFKYKI
jgi:hypothetical protein